MPELITKATPEQTPNSSVIKETTAFFNRSKIPPPVRLTQYDNLPFIAVHLVEGDDPYTVPEGAAVNIRMAKPVPSNKKVYNPAYGLSEDRHTVYIQVTPQMTVVAGCTNPVIEVVVDGGIACTGTLRLEIDPNPVQESDLIDTDEYKTLEEILAEAQAAAQIVQDNIDEINAIPENVEKAQTAQELAENAYAFANDKAIQAAASATAAGNSATSAAASAAEAAQSAAQAAGSSQLAFYMDPVDGGLNCTVNLDDEEEPT